MAIEENERIAICPVCLEGLTTDLYFTSDDYLYHKRCFYKLNYKNPLSRQDFLYYFPVNKVVDDKLFLKDTLKLFFKIRYDLDGFDQDGFSRKGFDRDGFNRKGIDEYGYISNKGLACKKKLKEAIRENPNTYQNVILRLKHNVDLAIFFLQ